jgi:electron transfer flavoprotein alpha subunit
VKLVVCLKQVPSLDRVRFDKANRIVREDVAAITNPLDLRALAHGLALRASCGGELVALTMGPPQARATLEDAIRRGADRAIHLLDKRFAGADTLATARALARALEREAPDLVLFGRNSLDGATAQVGPQVAELLGFPHLNQATTATLEEDRLTIERETERGSEEWNLPVPAAVSVETGPEAPDAERHRASEIEELGMDHLGGTPRDYGTRGSPTFVKEVRALSLERAGERLDDVETATERVLELAEDRKRPPAAESDAGDGHRQIWVLAERDGQRLHPGGLEGISCAREVAAELAAEIVGVLLCEKQDGLAETLAAHGADRVLVVRDPQLAENDPSARAAGLCAAIESRSPFAIIAPWTADARDYVPRAAARLGLGLTGDFVRLELDDRGDEPELMWVKPAWAGTVEAPIISHRSPALGTLRPGAFAAPVPEEGRESPVELFEPQLAPSDGPVCRRRETEIEDDPLLDAAQAVVCLGEGIDDEAVESGRSLAAALGGTVGGTRAAVDRGLVPPQLEIGIEKRSIAPQLVLALGVADPAPLDAVRAARTLVTVHPDPDAPAHERADLAVVAAPREFAVSLAKRAEVACAGS